MFSFPRVGVSLWAIVLGVVLPCVAGLGGCSATVRPAISQSEYLQSGAKIPRHVLVFVSPELRDYTAKSSDVGDMKEWTFVMGPATVDALRYEMESRFEKVEMRLGTPSYPVSPTDALVVVPAIKAFKADQPIMFKFEEYEVKLTIANGLTTAAGEPLLNKEYVGIGVKRGSIGNESGGHAANPEASRLAIKDAVKKLVDDVAQAAGQPR